VQTAISVGALITAVALFTALVVMIHSFRSTVALWVQQSIAGDIYVRPKLAELNRFRDPLPPRVVSAVQALPAPVALVPMRRLELGVNGHQHLFEAMDYAAYARRSRFIWMGGDTQQIEADLIAGKGVAVSEVFANSTGLNTGDRYRVQIGAQLMDEPILGVFRDYRTRGGAVYYSLTGYQHRFGDGSWSAVQINFTERSADLAAAIDRVRSALIDCCGDTIEMIEGQGLRRAILLIFDETFAITTVLLLIALVVAALGIATTLAVLVLQRRRQLNTIRAVGGSAAQLRRMIVWEASLIVLAGQAAGLACGFILSTLLIFVVNRQSFGWTFLYRVDWSSLLTALPLIFIAALLAALPAVRLALSTSPAMLLRGEKRDEDLPAEKQTRARQGNCPAKMGRPVCFPAVRRHIGLGGGRFSAGHRPLQRLSFPADHGPHTAYRTEWWYYTGNLTDADNHRYRLSADLFPQQLAPPGKAAVAGTGLLLANRPDLPGPCRVTDIGGGRHLQAERMARPVLSLAGAEQAGTAWKVHVSCLADHHHARGNHRLRPLPMDLPWTST
jgi:hypothetical protein